MRYKITVDFTFDYVDDIEAIEADMRESLDVLTVTDAHGYERTFEYEVTHLEEVPNGD